MVSFLAAAVERHALKCCVPDMRPVSLLSSLLLTTQRTRASMPHRGSQETILSESSDAAGFLQKKKKTVKRLSYIKVIKKDARMRFTLRAQFFLSFLPKLR